MHTPREDGAAPAAGRGRVAFYAAIAFLVYGLASLPGRRFLLLCLLVAALAAVGIAVHRSHPSTARKATAAAGILTVLLIALQFGLGLLLVAPFVDL